MPRWTTSASEPSSFSTRYFPRRCAATILRPTRTSTNSFLFLWRRTERAPVTSTALIFLPTTSRSRSRRITSTSGSSGIPAPLLSPVSLRLVLLQAGPRNPRRALFGLLLRAAFALAVAHVAEVDGGEEVLRVIGTLGSHDVARPPDRLRGRELLETRLVVAPARAGDSFGDPVLQAPQHEIAGGRE